ncbi:MAG: competence/damage-inducible protein A [Alphaproteobacteria bacterium]
MSKKYTAAMIVIGNEILSGRTQDKNINYVANALVKCGISLIEVRIIPDIEDVIVDTVATLKQRVDYVFTSGGIGPTHDDITADCIAKACGVEIKVSQDAHDMLLAHYGEADLNEARLRMARIPVGASLIPNPVSAAPGFIIENVHVMAGVPRIMQAMTDHVAATLKGGAILESRTVASSMPESVIAKGLGDIQDCYETVEIGSYPYFQDGVLGVNVVLRSSDPDALGQAEQAVQNYVDKQASQ